MTVREPVDAAAFLPARSGNVPWPKTTEKYSEEFTECDAETVAEQLDRQNFRVLALAVENVLQA